MQNVIQAKNIRARLCRPIKFLKYYLKFGWSNLSESQIYILSFCCSTYHATVPMHIKGRTVGRDANRWRGLEYNLCWWLGYNLIWSFFTLVTQLVRPHMSLNQVLWVHFLKSNLQSRIATWIVSGEKSKQQTPPTYRSFMGKKSLIYDQADCFTKNFSCRSRRPITKKLRNRPIMIGFSHSLGVNTWKKSLLSNSKFNTENEDANLRI